MLWVCVCVCAMVCDCVCVCVFVVVVIVDRQPFNLTTLRGCEVMLLDHSDQVQVDDVADSRLFIGA